MMISRNVEPTSLLEGQAALASQHVPACAIAGAGPMELSDNFVTLGEHQQDA